MTFFDYEIASLDSYIDKMDESALAFVERLVEFGNQGSMADVANIVNHMTLEVTVTFSQRFHQNLKS